MIGRRETVADCTMVLGAFMVAWAAWFTWDVVMRALFAIIGWGPIPFYGKEEQ
jgi:hypothetical protein